MEWGHWFLLYVHLCTFGASWLGQQKRCCPFEIKRQGWWSLAFCWNQQGMCCIDFFLEFSWKESYSQHLEHAGTTWACSHCWNYVPFDLQEARRWQSHCFTTTWMQVRWKRKLAAQQSKPLDYLYCTSHFNWGIKNVHSLHFWILFTFVIHFGGMWPHDVSTNPKHHKQFWNQKEPGLATLLHICSLVVFLHMYMKNNCYLYGVKPWWLCEHDVIYMVCSHDGSVNMMCSQDGSVNMMWSHGGYMWTWQLPQIHWIIWCQLCGAQGLKLYLLGIGFGPCQANMEHENKQKEHENCRLATFPDLLAIQAKWLAKWLPI